MSILHRCCLLGWVQRCSRNSSQSGAPAASHLLHHHDTHIYIYIYMSVMRANKRHEQRRKPGRGYRDRVDNSSVCQEALQYPYIAFAKENSIHCMPLPPVIHRDDRDSARLPSPPRRLLDSAACAQPTSSLATLSPRPLSLLTAIALHLLCNTHIC